MGVVYQLASAPCCKATIATAGLAIGSGANATLLGFNVVGVVIAWALALVTLLENPLGALLTQACMPTRDRVQGVNRPCRSSHCWRTRWARC